MSLDKRNGMNAKSRKALAFMFVAVLALAGLGAQASAAIAGAAAASATAAAAAAKTTSLDEVRAAALKKSAALRKAGISVESALTAEQIQANEALPSLSASASAALSPLSLADGSAGWGSASVGLSSSVPLWDGGRGEILLSIDRLSTKAARSAARVAYFSALEDADAAYYAVLSGKDSVTAALNDLDNASLGLALAKAQLEAGVSTKADLLKAQAEAASKETVLSQARQALQSATMKLSSITGLALPLEPAAVDFDSWSAVMARLADISDPALEAFVAKVQASGLENNPSIASAQLAADKARLSIDSAKADYMPSVSASASSGLKYSIGATEPLSPSLSLGVSAALPLDYWSRGPGVKAKELALESSSIDLDEAKRGLELDVRTAAYSWLAASRSARSSAKALEYSESNYATVLESYKLSLVTASDLSDAALLVSNNRNSLNAARYQFLNALSSLKTLAGLESDGLLAGLVP